MAVNCSDILKNIIYGGFISGFIVLIAGCDRSPTTVEHPGFPRQSLAIDGEVNFRSSIAWDDVSDSLSTKIWAENIGEEPAEVRTGPCSFIILAYTLKGDERNLIWTNSMPKGYICPDEMLVYTIKPNESVQLDRLMYISGKHWKHELPEGDWQFYLKSKTEEGKTISTPSNRLVIN